MHGGDGGGVRPGNPASTRLQLWTPELRTEQDSPELDPWEFSDGDI